MKHTKVMAIYPHLDDETFGKSSALALHVQEDAVVCGTLGQMGKNMGKPIFATRESMSEIREKELRVACEALGVKNIYLHGLCDKMVEFEDPDYVANLILKIMEDVRPTLIYTYYSPYRVHPNHDAMALATLIVVRRLPENASPQIYASPITHDIIKILSAPDVELDVTNVLDAKLTAYRAHRSQSEAMMARMRAKIAEHPELREEIECPLKQEQYWIYTV